MSALMLYGTGAFRLLLLLAAEIIPILTPCAAKHGIRSWRGKHLIAAFANPQWFCIVGYQKVEHHFYRVEQGVEIPKERGLIQQLDMIARCNAAKRTHGSLQHKPRFLVGAVVVLIVKLGIQHIERPILELRRYPVNRFGVLAKAAHIHGYRIVLKGIDKLLHIRRVGIKPVSAVEVELTEWKKALYVLCGLDSFVTDKPILLQIDHIIFEEIGCCGQRGHNAEQAVFLNELKDLPLRYIGAASTHQHHSHIQRIEHHLS